MQIDARRDRHTKSIHGSAGARTLGSIPAAPITRSTVGVDGRNVSGSNRQDVTGRRDAHLCSGIADRTRDPMRPIPGRDLNKLRGGFAMLATGYPSLRAQTGSRYRVRHAAPNTNLAEPDSRESYAMRHVSNVDPTGAIRIGMNRTLNLAGGNKFLPSAILSKGA